MKRSQRISTAVALLLLSCLAIQAQPEFRRFDPSSARIEVQLSKKEYFPCEMIEFQVKLTNSSDRLALFPPLDRRPHAFVNVEEATSDGVAINSVFDPRLLGNRPPVEDGNTLRLDPGATVVRAYDLSGETPRYAAPCHSGFFLIVFRYLDRVWTAHGSVVRPTEVQAISKIDVPDTILASMALRLPRSFPAQKHLQPGPMKQVSFVYGYESSSHVCSIISPLYSANDSDELQIQLKVGTIGPGVPKVEAPIRCTSVGQGKVSSLTSRWNSQSQLEIEFEDDSKRQRRITLDRKWKQIK